MYRFCLWSYSNMALLFGGRDRATRAREQMLAALADGKWSGEATYDFWQSVGQAWVSLAALIGVITGVIMLILRPGSESFHAAMVAPALLFGFAGGGALAIAPAIWVSWYRRLGSRPLAPRRGANGLWMLAVQVPSAVLLALAVR